MLITTLFSVALIATRPADPIVLDACESPDNWRVIASDGVEARVSLVEGRDGRGIRLDYDFHGTAGFCVLRRELSLPIPPNYRFSYAIRGEGPANNLEFKLVDGDDVWWVVRREFEPPAQWRVVSERARGFSFAWGPSGGRPLTRINALEFAVAAAAGGKGYLAFDQLTFEELPPTAPPAGATQIRTSSAPAAREAPAASRPAATLPADGTLYWATRPDEANPWLQLDFDSSRELGGLALDWGDHFPEQYTLAASGDAQQWETIATVRDGNGGADYVITPGAAARHLRIAAPRGGFELRRLRVMDADFGASPNAAYAVIAREAPRGRYPRYLLAEQSYWTVAGLPDDDREALLDADGAVEFDRACARVEPSLFVNDRLLTWADAERLYALADGYLPIPTVTWRLPDAPELSITLDNQLLDGCSVAVARYHLINRTGDPVQGRLFLTIRPFQVLPPWQTLNLAGGFTRINSLAWNDGRLTVTGRSPFVVQTGPPAAAFGAAVGPAADVTDWLAGGKLPPRAVATDESGLCCGSLAYAFNIRPGASAQFAVVVAREPSDRLRAVLEAQQSRPPFASDNASAWAEQLNRVRLELPPSGRRLANTFRTTQGYILVNADGPAIQPGSRTYERSWIRDGALTCTALLHTGHPERVQAFIDWYAAYQFPSGKIPCVVDRRGADPVDEHDSTGEFLYLLGKYWKFTRDRGVIERHFDRVARAVDYLDGLRRQRLTPEYRDATDWRAACRGLVPESISHEGYSAKPMHSYWDDFWTLRGLASAAEIAAALERHEAETRFGRIRDEFRAHLAASIRRAMQDKGVDYVPGCVELGDFDATSTAVAVWPCGDAQAIPADALIRTFDRYYEFVRGRRAPDAEWVNFTPYELRAVGALIRLGQPVRAHELLDFLMRYQRPPGWNHWAEVVWREPDAPRFIGDMPHTWCGSEFINSVRTTFVYESESDHALVLAAGVRPEWAAASPGVSVGAFPTEFGPVSYRIAAAGGRVTLTLDGGFEVPAGGIRFRSPLAGAPDSATIDGQPLPLEEGGWVTFRRAPAVIEVTQTP